MTISATADAISEFSAASDGRPDFVARLGLLLPCTAQDVEAAYRDRAKSAHPDAGGSTSEFIQLQADYEAAKEYAQFHDSRRAWLATKVERYAAQQEVIAEIERLGGEVETQRPAWLAREVGDDFAQLLDTITGVRLTGPMVGMKEVEYLAGRIEVLANLHRLDLSESRVDHQAVKCLTVFATLHDLNLSGTMAGDRTVAVLAELSALRRVNLADTPVSWRGRLRLRRRRPDLEVVTRSDAQPGAVNAKRVYRWMLRALAAYLVAMIMSTHAPMEPKLMPSARWPGADKLAHLGLYCGFSCLLALVLALRNAYRGMRAGLSATQYAWIAACVTVYAAADELTQPWTGRETDVRDWIADIIGMTLGLLVFTVAWFYLRRRRQRLLGLQF